MDSLNFSALAPRYGTRPLYNGSSLGVSALNGGAINWGSMWNAFKNVGSRLKNVGAKVWNSKTAQSIRKELGKTGAQEKLVQGVVTGVHGALDLANQALAKQIEKRLDKAPLTEEEEAEVLDSALETPEEVPPLPPKRPREEPILLEKPVVLEKPLPLEKPIAVEKEKIAPAPEPMKESLIATTDEPPSYEEAIRTTAPAPLLLPRPAPAAKGPLLAPVARKPSPAPLASVVPAVGAPSANWLSALNSMTGVGLRTVKRRRCY